MSVSVPTCCGGRMGKRQAFTKAALANAAAVAREVGVTICLEAPDGTVYRIAPDVAPLPPMGTGAKECSEADKAFGL